MTWDESSVSGATIALHTRSVKWNLSWGGRKFWELQRCIQSYLRFKRNKYFKGRVSGAFSPPRLLPHIVLSAECGEVVVAEPRARRGID